MNSSFCSGSSILYSHLKYNPADYKVACRVNVNDLGLTPPEIEVFIALVGPRYNQGRKEARLTCDRFPNRIENKRYLTIILEVTMLLSTICLLTFFLTDNYYGPISEACFRG